MELPPADTHASSAPTILSPPFIDSQNVMPSKSPRKAAEMTRRGSRSGAERDDFREAAGRRKNSRGPGQISHSLPSDGMMKVN